MSRTVQLHAAGETPQNFLWASAQGEVEFLAAADGDAPSVPKFTTLAYSGGEIDVDYFGRAVIDLAGVTVEAQSIPILQHHRRERIVGHTEAIELSTRSIRARGLLSGSGEAALEVASSAKNGFPWKTSVGGPVARMEHVEAGEKVQVNGRNFNGPINVIRAMTLKEISFVPIAGDKNATARVAAGAREMSFSEWLTAKGFDPESITDEQRTFLKALYEEDQGQEPAPPKATATKTAPPKKDDLAAAGSDGASTGRGPSRLPEFDAAKALEDLRAAQADEETRCSEIRRLCAEAGDPSVKIDGKSQPLAAYAIRHNLTAEQTELHILRTSRPEVAAGHVSRETPNGEVIEAALSMSIGVPVERLEASYSEQVLTAASRPQMRGLSVHGLFDAVLRAAGKTWDGSRKSSEYIREVFLASKNLEASGFSTISLPGILSNVANKQLERIYMAQNTAWQEICGIRSFNDFKPHLRYRLDSEGAFRKVAPDGQITHSALSEASFTNKLDTYATMLSLTRQEIINDDLGAFNDRATLLAQLAAHRVEEAVFTLLLASGTHFDTANGNLLTGAANVVSIEGYTAAVQLFGDQVDVNNKPIMVMPDRVLTGTANHVAAQELFDSIRVDVTPSATASKRNIAENPHRGAYRPVKTPWLNNTAIRDQNGDAVTGQSATQWFLFGDPMMRATIAIAFLNGRQIPTVESADTDFDTLGVQMRGYLDFGVGLEDPKAAVKVTGVDP